MTSEPIDSQIWCRDVPSMLCRAVVWHAAKAVRNSSTRLQTQRGCVCHAYSFIKEGWQLAARRHPSPKTITKPIEKYTKNHPSQNPDKPPKTQDNCMAGALSRHGASWHHAWHHCSADVLVGLRTAAGLCCRASGAVGSLLGCNVHFVEALLHGRCCHCDVVL